MTKPMFARLFHTIHADRLKLFNVLSAALAVTATLFVYGCGSMEDGSGLPAIEYIQPSDELGASMATVTGDVPLAHTASFMATDEDGSLEGAGDVRAQADRILENMQLALEEVDSDLDGLLKINVYAASTETVGEIRHYFAERFSGQEKPAIAYTVSRLPHTDALLAMDAVAVAPGSVEHTRRVVRRAEGLSGAGPDRGDVAIMPPGGKVYLSGQVAEGEPEEAMRESLESLHDRLAWLGLSADDVVQLKLFVGEIADAGRLEEKMAEYYRNKPAPPIVTVEWTHPGVDIEVELIAARGMPPYDSEEAVTYPLPAGLETFPQYSRVAEIHRGKIVYLSGLYGDVEQDGEGQIRTIFDQMGRILEEAGSDFDHLAKATYYVSGWDAGVRSPLGSVRAEVYDPNRPPTSSLIPVRSVGKEGALISVDMIGVLPEQAGL